MTAIDSIRRVFQERGASRYGHEAVSQLEHALQAACFAERAQSTPELVTAALLHDVGHLLHDLDDDAPEQGVDDQHERAGARWLEQWFGPAVVRPMELHVAAKRYLCTTDANYYGRLSEPSIVSLRLQGGPMSPSEVSEFERDPFHQDAVRLRHWDEAAKVPEMITPPLEHFLLTVSKAVIFQ